MFDARTTSSPKDLSACHEIPWCTTSKCSAQKEKYFWVQNARKVRACQLTLEPKLLSKVGKVISLQKGQCTWRVFAWRSPWISIKTTIMVLSSSLFWSGVATLIVIFLNFVFCAICRLIFRRYGTLAVDGEWCGKGLGGGGEPAGW